MNAQKLKEICARQGIIFVHRSYGQATTQTVTLEALQNVVDECCLNLQQELNATRAAMETLQQKR